MPSRPKAPQKSFLSKWEPVIKTINLKSERPKHKAKAPALDRLVRQAMRRAESLDGAWVVICERKRLRELIQDVAAECARIADESGRFRQDAVDAIRREFRIEEGEDG